MSPTSSSQQRMDEKLAQFQEEVRLRQEEAAAKALTKAHYNNSCMLYSWSSCELSSSCAASADLVALSAIIIYGALLVLFSFVLFFAGFIFLGLFSWVCPFAS